jgi:hypothetical protein
MKNKQKEWHHATKTINDKIPELYCLSADITAHKNYLKIVEKIFKLPLLCRL